MSNEQKQQINHTMHINAFLNAISAFDENLEKKHRNKLNELFGQDAELIRSDSNFINIANIIEINKIINKAYQTLYEEGIVDILVHIINKCGSLTYFAELLGFYIAGVCWKLENQTVFYIDEERIKKISNDKEYNDEFKALHLGLHSLLPLVYPGNNPENAKFTHAEIHPFLDYSILDGLKFIFKFKCLHTHYAFECHLKFQFNLSRLRKGNVVQVVQCLNNVNKYNEDISCCKFIQFGNHKPEYSIKEVLKKLDM